MRRDEDISFFHLRGSDRRAGDECFPFMVSLLNHNSWIPPGSPEFSELTCKAVPRLDPRCKTCSTLGTLLAP